MKLDPSLLGPTQARVYQLYLQGLSTREMGEVLGIRRKTAQQHVWRIRQMVAGEVPQYRRKVKALALDAKLGAHGRCPIPRCSLLLPHVCLGTAADIAQLRTSDPGGS